MNNFKKIIKKFPTLIGFFLFLIVLFLNLGKSNNPDIFIWSYFRFAFLGIFFCLVIYFLISLSKPKLLFINNYVCYLIVIVLLFIEILIHLKPNIIPNEMIIYLPQDIRQQLADQRGFFCKDHLIGEGLFYHYKPYQALERAPYIKIDQYGYRNAVELGEQVDIVILGDSLTIAEASEVDFGDLFRNKGYSAVNLGMGGYSPQHYLSAYKEYIINKKIPHKFVLTFLFIGNDIKDSYDYAETLNQKGNYFDYLGEEGEKNYAFLPWTINIIRGMRLFVFRLFNQNGKTETINIPYAVNLPYKNIQVSKSKFAESLKLDFTYLKKSIDEINLLAVENNATPLVFLIPLPSKIYAEYNNVFQEEALLFSNIRNSLEKYLLEKNVDFVDLSEIMQKKIEKNFLFASEEDCHFNTLGVEKIFGTVLDSLKNSIDKGSND